VSDGVFTYEPVTEDSVVWERARVSTDADGLTLTKGFVIGMNKNDPAATPCPCCPVGSGGCCKPCTDYTMINYRDMSQAIALVEMMKELLPFVHDFEEPGKVIVTCAIQMTSLTTDSVEFEYGLAMAGKETDMREVKPETTMKRLSMSKGTRWVTLREEFNVEKGQVRFTLTGGVPAGVSDCFVKKCVMQLSYFPDLKNQN